MKNKKLLICLLAILAVAVLVLSSCQKTEEKAKEAAAAVEEKVEEVKEEAAEVVDTAKEEAAAAVDTAKEEVAAARLAHLLCPDLALGGLVLRLSLPHQS